MWQQGLGIYDRMRSNDTEGIQPLNRLKDWNREERIKRKRLKENNWSRKGGHIAPIFVPATPGGELAKEIRKIAESEAGEGKNLRLWKLVVPPLKICYKSPIPQQPLAVHSMTVWHARGGGVEGASV